MFCIQQDLLPQNQVSQRISKGSDRNHDGAIPSNPSPPSQPVGPKIQSIAGGNYAAVADKHPETA